MISSSSSSGSRPSASHPIHRPAPISTAALPSSVVAVPSAPQHVRSIRGHQIYLSLISGTRLPVDVIDVITSYGRHCQYIFASLRLPGETLDRNLYFIEPFAPSLPSSMPSSTENKYHDTTIYTSDGNENGNEGNDNPDDNSGSNEQKQKSSSMVWKKVELRFPEIRLMVSVSCHLVFVFEDAGTPHIGIYSTLTHEWNYLKPCGISFQDAIIAWPASPHSDTQVEEGGYVMIWNHGICILVDTKNNITTSYPVESSSGSSSTDAVTQAPTTGTKAPVAYLPGLARNSVSISHGNGTYSFGNGEACFFDYANVKRGGPANIFKWWSLRSQPTQCTNKPLSLHSLDRDIILLVYLSSSADKTVTPFVIYHTGRNQYTIMTNWQHVTVNPKHRYNIQMIDDASSLPYGRRLVARRYAQYNSKVERWWTATIPVITLPDIQVSNIRYMTAAKMAKKRVASAAPLKWLPLASITPLLNTSAMLTVGVDL
jgi:hypothetical protein